MSRCYSIWVLFVTCTLILKADGIRSPLSRSSVLQFAKDVTIDSFNVRNGIAQNDIEQLVFLGENLLRKPYWTLPPYGQNISACHRSLEMFAQDFFTRIPYATQMVDSWGKRQSGLKKGNYKWRGEYFECSSARSMNFTGKWCNIVFSAVPDGGGLNVGTCLPDTCTEIEIGNLYQALLNTSYARAYCPEQPVEYTAVDITALVICSILGMIIFASTMYEVILIVKKDGNEQKSVLTRLALSFSVIKNTTTLLDTTQKEGNINVLHGLRFISMTWVILGHAYLFSLAYIDNIVDFGDYYITHGSFQAIANGTFSVDTFFFLSGLLVAYLGMKELEKRAGKINVPLMYLSRYLRLTPAYALVILLSSSLFSKIGDGPTWETTVNDMKQPCSDYWWTNLIYINNLYPTNLFDECIGWSWYLGNDMQFYLIAPFLLLLLFKKPRVGLGVLAFLTFGSMLSTGVLSSHYKLQPDPVSYSQLSKLLTANLKSSNAKYSSDHILASVKSEDPSDADKFWSDIYAKPWCRMGVYFIGIATGFLLHITKLRLHLPRAIVIVSWLVVSVLQLAILYGLCGPVLNMTLPTINTAAFYNAVSRPIWAGGLAWLTIACVSGYGGPINSFLSWKVFIPLSRLTYCAYLMHPLVITYLYSYRENEMHFSINEILSYYIASVIISYAVAYVLSMTIEVPMIGIQKMMFPRAKPRSQQQDEGIVNINYLNRDMNPLHVNHASAQYSIAT